MQTQTKKILVVDDEADVRNYLATALEDAGFAVTTAEDGEDGLEKIKQDPPDLISLDLVMPRRSGAMLHRELQKRKEWSNIPVLIVTGHARDELGRADFEELTMSGPGIYLEKPVSPATYVRAVQQLLGGESEAKPAEDADALRSALLKKLQAADAATLKKMLDSLK
ncbi:MAG: response regulator [Myxococcales bacterium]|nr:MAG: response regulator [Myxococcales bacterium]